QLVNLTNCNSGKTLRVESLNNSAGIDRPPENFEIAGAKFLTEIDQLHSKPAIRLVAAEPANRFAISQAVERRLDFEVASGLENRRQHSFGQSKDVRRHDERRLNVDLGEFRLPIRAKIFIAKTFRDLEIFLHARDLKQLLVLLGGLREGIKFPGSQAAWDQ